MLLVKFLPEDERASYLDMTEPELRLLADASRRFKRESLSYHFTLLDSALKDMARLPQTKRLSAELTLIKMADTSLETSAEALLSRIAALEEKVSLLESMPYTVPSADSPAVSVPPQTTVQKTVEETSEKKSKLYPALGILAGLAAVILML